MLPQLIIVCLATSALAESRFQRPGFNQGYSGSQGYAAAPARALTDEDGYTWKPYSFGYDTVDEYGTRLFHREESNANNAKTGSYGYTDPNGIYRRVNYVADANGFRATIETNEPGTKAGASADAIFNANPIAVGSTFGARRGFGAAAYGSRGVSSGSGSAHHGSSESGRYVYNPAASGRPGYKQGGYGKAEYGQAGNVEVGYGQGGRAQSGNAEATGYGQAGYVQAGYTQTGHGQARYGQSGYGQSGYGQSRYDPYRPAHHGKSHTGFKSWSKRK